VPVGSATVKSALSATNAATCVFRPDVTGEYTVTCLVDGATLYVLRCSVIALVPTSFAGAMHFLAVPDAAVPVPATGKTQYLSADTGQMSFKLPNGTIERVTVT
jgi:hypothetical protein